MQAESGTCINPLGGPDTTVAFGRNECDNEKYPEVTKCILSVFSILEKAKRTHSDELIKSLLTALEIESVSASPLQETLKRIAFPRLRRH